MQTFAFPDISKPVADQILRGYMIAPQSEFMCRQKPIFVFIVSRPMISRRFDFFAKAIVVLPRMMLVVPTWALRACRPSAPRIFEAARRSNF
jgi:hypothetical protein